MHISNHTHMNYILKNKYTSALQKSCTHAYTDYQWIKVTASSPPQRMLPKGYAGKRKEKSTFFPLFSLCFPIIKLNIFTFCIFIVLLNSKWVHLLLIINTQLRYYLWFIQNNNKLQLQKLTLRRACLVPAQC